MTSHHGRSSPVNVNLFPNERPGAPSASQIAAEIAHDRQFGLIIDEPRGRHVFINPTKEGLIVDVVDWFNECPGPNTTANITNVTAGLTKIRRGQTFHTGFVGVH